MRLALVSLFLLAGCAAQLTSAPASDVPSDAARTPETSVVAASNVVTAQAAMIADEAEADDEGASDFDGTDAVAAGDDDEGDDEAAAVEEEGESHDVDPSASTELRHTADLSDEELERRWVKEPESLGSISIGFVDEGRLVNSVQFPAGDDWLRISPHKGWATQETVDYLAAAIRHVRQQYPDAPPLRVNELSPKDGGYARPHKSHQNGRDVDLGFYYPTVEVIRVREREKVIDVALNWALVKALVTQTDVQLILVDRRIIDVLHRHALAIGEDPKWLDSIFRAGSASIVKHARRHRDHFHVRFFNPRAQELGRRVAPLLARRPDQNIAFHRVRSGDTLGAIARRYNSSVKTIQRANGMRGSFLRIAQVLKVPMRGPCTRCPVPPPAVIPPRRLPPRTQVASARPPAPPAPSATVGEAPEPVVVPASATPAATREVRPATATVPADDAVQASQNTQVAGDAITAEGLDDRFSAPAP